MNVVSISRRQQDKYLESLLRKRKKSINKSNYTRIGLKGLYIKHYGKDLENKVDDITHIKCKKRRFCIECTLDKEECPGWNKCINRKEVLKIINSN